LINSPAYDELIVQLVTDTKASSEFMEKLMPEKMQKELREELLKLRETPSPDPFKETTLADSAKEDDRPLWMKEDRHPTNAEMISMSREELVQAFAWREARNK
jgi:hypothetical protein